jgi:hypothetical protein
VFASSPGQKHASRRQQQQRAARLVKRECERQLECLKSIINLTIDFLTHKEKKKLDQDVARYHPRANEGPPFFGGAYGCGGA